VSILRWFEAHKPDANFRKGWCTNYPTNESHHAQRKVSMKSLVPNFEVPNFHSFRQPTPPSCRGTYAPPAATSSTKRLHSRKSVLQPKSGLSLSSRTSKSKWPLLTPTTMRKMTHWTFRSPTYLPRSRNPQRKASRSFVAFVPCESRKGCFGRRDSYEIT
jgi:hypothetical protein